MGLLTPNFSVAVEIEPPESTSIKSNQRRFIFSLLVEEGSDVRPVPSDGDVVGPLASQTLLVLAEAHGQQPFDGLLVADAGGVVKDTLTGDVRLGTCLLYQLVKDVLVALQCQGYGTLARIVGDEGIGTVPQQQGCQGKVALGHCQSYGCAS